MNPTEQESLEIRFALAEAAVTLYESGNGEFTLKELASACEMSVSEIFTYFPGKREILLFYYESVMIRYRMMLDEIDGFEDYLLAEKLSNFAYTTFDLLGEHKKFVDDTFHPMILSSCGVTEFENDAENLLREFLSADSRISMSASLVMNDLFYRMLTKKYLLLISFWLGDDSDGSEESVELTDKYTAFIQELAYGSAIDRGVDLAKFILSSSLVSRPLDALKKLFPEIEIRD